MKQKLVLIGASTGGPGHLRELFRDIILPQNVSIVIAQHMNKAFLPSFVKEFNKDIKSEATMVKEKELLKNQIYICEKNSIILDTKQLMISPDNSGIPTIFNPNVNMLFSSAVSACKFSDVFAVLLTGLGDDGAIGLDKLYKSGAKCIAENEETAIVYGMPKRAKELNPKLETANLHNIKIELEKFINE
ncbi:CheB methylesterase domain-containing protein [Campylobacter hyointestinalis]|uniref:protein-glutamate methylesterase n=1 Tax=Campylobacter hyointestinalis subsp. lawsonii TaxID=91353 RepID=A0AAV6EIF8_CAMHY|nr:CheB methylesterase domain-containing protein [Campylobacter hyointestinalis]KAB0612742.1 chemotaxis protein CheB [Campylobacter hyointestinalis subsp. lawsonii]QKF69642.1 MCP protein-glutamate methylesterase [Campylobacter hyointestinalis subsp. lawsonii]RAZ27822.1 chemotaxis protein CheB [Campylobacter hyointestinalis subsp. lawsonii]RAZ53754.1 chemotaxis protein CheB [Campylobacter hyointestinalis subsp. lawsonii]RAZ62643.1 chemotaxis protein CheB [Campylobacter hyointestinalis subsp. la